MLRGQANHLLISALHASWGDHAVFCRLRMIGPANDLPIDKKTGKTRTGGSE
jgi:hypothetical protein